MRQILHIFSKDVRRLWVEILLAILAVMLFAWIDPKSWLKGPMFVQNPYQGIDNLLHLLLLLSWALLIARLIHGEVLVGDRQFWITRPYQWAKLLSAKALFIALFIYLPFLLMQTAILLQAGFNPLSYIPGLLCELVLISLVFIPLIALSVVTSSLARFSLTILGLFVVFSLAVSSITSIVGGNGNNGPVSFSLMPSGGFASIAAYLVVCGAVIVLQYSKRRVLEARILLGSAPLLFLVVSFVCNRNVWVDRAFPPAAPTEPSVIRMIPFNEEAAKNASLGGMSWTESGGNNYFNIDAKKWTVIKVELRASGIAAGERWQLDAFRPTLTPRSGVPIKLDWQRAHEVFDKPDDPSHFNYYDLYFLLRTSDYERLRLFPITLHLDFALTQARPARTWQLALRDGDFMIPDLGSCSTTHDRQRELDRIMGVICRFPLKTPPVTTVETLLTRGTCESGAAQSGDPALRTSNTIGEFDGAPASFGISPVEQRSFLDRPNYSGDSRAIPVQLCPGTPMKITQYQKVRTVQTGITIENFNIARE